MTTKTHLNQLRDTLISLIILSDIWQSAASNVKIIDQAIFLRVQPSTHKKVIFSLSISVYVGMSGMYVQGE